MRHHPLSDGGGDVVGVGGYLLNRTILGQSADLLDVAVPIHGTAAGALEPCNRWHGCDRVQKSGGTVAVAILAQILKSLAQHLGIGRVCDRRNQYEQRNERRSRYHGSARYRGL